MLPTEPDQDGDEQPGRSHGTSPVANGGVRSKLGLAAGVLGLLLVVGFLFVTSGHHAKPKVAPKPLLAANTQSSPAPPQPARQAAPSRDDAAKDARQKEQARLHSPMLIYDRSGRPQAAAPTTKAPPPNPLSSLIAEQLRNANAASGDQERARGTPAEGYAARTRAFAKTAASQREPEAIAHRISMDNRIAEGRVLAATLETAINSDLPGKLRAIVSSDVWSEDGSRRLIVKGSRLIGEYRSGLVRGQTRVFVIWTRLLEPDGTDVSIGSPGTDDLGRAGLTGTIDRHFAERFGAAFLLSLIGSATTASQGGNTFVINTSQGFGQVAQNSLQDSINIPPTITVDQGTPVQVFVARDLVFDRPPATAQ